MNNDYFTIILNENFHLVDEPFKFILLVNGLDERFYISDTDILFVVNIIINNSLSYCKSINELVSYIILPSINSRNYIIVKYDESKQLFSSSYRIVKDKVYSNPFKQEATNELINKFMEIFKESESE